MLWHHLHIFYKQDKTDFINHTLEKFTCYNSSLKKHTRTHALQCEISKHCLTSHIIQGSIVCWVGCTGGSKFFILGASEHNLGAALWKHCENIPKHESVPIYLIQFLGFSFIFFNLHLHNKYLPIIFLFSQCIMLQKLLLLGVDNELNIVCFDTK